MSMTMQPQQYPMGQGMAFNQVIRRLMTDAERQLGMGYFKKMQRGLRGLAFVSLVFFGMNMYFASTFSDETVTMMLSIFMIVIGAMALGMSVNVLTIRKKVADAMRDGTAVEVFGPAYRSRAMKNVPSWTVGPISFMGTREVNGIIQEGAQTSVLCLPRLKVAVAVNNFGLKNGVAAQFPPNLEAMATPTGGVAMPGQPAQDPRLAYRPTMAQGPSVAASYAEEEPPPPPPDF